MSSRTPKPEFLRQRIRQLEGRCRELTQAVGLANKERDDWHNRYQLMCAAVELQKSKAESLNRKLRDYRFNRPHSER
jgi:hypothetical protein